METSLNLRASHQLALTPQLQKAIRLLQLSTTELQQEVATALTQNPFLENEEEVNSEETTPCDTNNFDGSNNEIRENTSANEYTNLDNDTKNLQGKEAETSPSNSENNEWEPNKYDLGGTSGSDDDSPRPLHEIKVDNLHDHLYAQLGLKQLNIRENALVTLLIESINDKGYLDDTLEEILQDLPSELNITLNELKNALLLVQNLDPPGIGARNASECLEIQLNRLEESPIRTLALEIVNKHLKLLAAHDYTRLRRQLKTNEENLRKAHDLVKSLEPFPGALYNQIRPSFIIPDVIVKKNAKNWQVELNPEVLPRLKINHLYAKILHNHKDASSTESLRQKLQEARWLIKNINQRFQTILRVGQAIVERQKEFFVQGDIAMRPLVLREIADTLSLHESTVSRATSGKYMLTPTGTFELKYFFASGISTYTGGVASSTAIRAFIKQLISAENAKTPLSDSEITKLLTREGFIVARRTIAKYREKMNIPPINLRKML